MVFSKGQDCTLGSSWSSILGVASPMTKQGGISNSVVRPHLLHSETDAVFDTELRSPTMRSGVQPLLLQEVGVLFTSSNRIVREGICVV